MSELTKSIAKKPFRFWYGPGMFILGKERLRQYCAGMIQSYSLGDQMNEQDFSFMLHLVCRHPQALEKIAPGLRAVKVRPNPRYNPRGLNGHRTLYLQRADGTETYISLETCVNGRNTAADVRTCFRREVESSVIRWKQRQFDAKGGRMATMPCPITGAPIRWNYCEVDHVPPWEFATILKAFLDERGLDLASIAIQSLGPGESRFENRVLAADWVMFHDSRAQYRLLSVDGHRQLTAERDRAKRAKCDQTGPNEPATRHL